MPKIAPLCYEPAPQTLALKPVTRTTWQGLKSSIRRYAELEYSVLTGNLNISEYHHTLLTRSNRGDIAIGMAVEDLLVSYLQPRPQISTLAWGDLSKSVVSTINSENDIFVICGGGYIFLDATGNLNKTSSDIVHLRSIDVPKIAYGIGLNRLMYESPVTEFRRLPPNTIEWLREFSNILRHISVRDHETAALFKTVAGREVQVIGDPALFLADESNVALDATKVNCRLQVGINLAAHGWRAIVVLKKKIRMFEELYRWLTDSLGAELTYFMHDDLERPVIEYLLRRDIPMKVLRCGPKELVREYGKVDLVINQMLHASILAFCAATPSINIAYDTKSLSFYSLFDLQEMCVSWSESSLPTLQSMVQHVLKNRQRILSQIATRKATLRQRHHEFIVDAFA